MSAATLPPQCAPSEAERDVIKTLTATHPMKAGEIWFLISLRWFTCWKIYVSYYCSPSSSSGCGAAPRPGPISNSDLLEEDGELKYSVSEMTHYEVVSGVVWNTLKGWYSGGPDIPRPVISFPALYGNVRLSVELQPLRLHIAKSSDTTASVLAYFSRIDTVGHLKKTMCERMGLEPDNIHVWDYHSGIWLKELHDQQTLHSEQILHNQTVILDNMLPIMDKKKFNG
ncbi:Peptidase C19, ubiquitin carboxyl-terminal hydrolase 2 [Pelomyxa schiedti]|nr:Peptidase C19, ubiquitin carboxyl-terminal hydrolase 2 [Pelomyxa schiedti]